jgi:hypothetical protein
LRKKRKKFGKSGKIFPLFAFILDFEILRMNYLVFLVLSIEEKGKKIWKKWKNIFTFYFLPTECGGVAKLLWPV